MGWIKLDRKICSNWIWQDKPFTKGQAWIDLLLLADYEDNDGYYRNSVKHFKAGTVYRSYSLLAERWGWSRNKVRRFVKMLEAENMILANATTNDTTLTIVNWALYQHRDTTGDTTHDTTSETTHDTTGDTHTRNNKEIYKEKKEIGSTEPEEDYSEFEEGAIQY